MNTREEIKRSIHTENFINQFGHTTEIQEGIFVTPKNGKQVILTVDSRCILKS